MTDLFALPQSVLVSPVRDEDRKKSFLERKIERLMGKLVKANNKNQEIVLRQRSRGIGSCGL